MELDTILGIGLLVATVVLAAATVALWRSTSKLARFTGDSVRLTQESLRVAELSSAPRLTLKKGSRSQVGDTHMDGTLRVDNLGGGLAENVEVVTSWGLALLGIPILRPDDWDTATVRITWKEWEQRKGTDDKDPVPERVKYIDSRGRIRDEPVQYAGGDTWVATVSR
jgi:hypothetical protein